MTRVLVVDDIAENLYLLQVLLGESGFAVVPARNGAEALEAARRDPPDLVISDILMPVLDGYGLCRELRADPRLRSIPFVFYTATYTDPRDEALALSLGADRFVVKPQEPEVLLQIVRGVLDARTERTQAPPRAPAPEALAGHNDALMRKLEQKMAALEATNRSLEEEIARRALAEEALRQSEERFRTFFDNAPIGKCVTSLDGRLLRVNPAFAAMLSYPMAELQAATFAAITHPDSLAASEECARALLQGERETLSLEKDYLARGGRVVNARVTVRVQRDGAGQPLHFLTHVEDVTELRRAEAGRQNRDKLMALGQLASGVAHDFNNVLVSILYQAEELEERYPNDAGVTGAARGILSAVAVATELSGRLLQFARRNTDAERTYDAHGAVQAALQLFATAGGRRLQVVRRLAPGTAFVRGSPSLLQNAVLNLCLNARDAMPRGGRIELESRWVELREVEPDWAPAPPAPGAYLLLTVRDTGEGMSAEVLARCREPFFTTKGEGGTGLGLAMVANAAAEHGGAMRIESVPQQGTAVTLLLQASAGQAAP